MSKVISRTNEKMVSVKKGSGWVAFLAGGGILIAGSLIYTLFFSWGSLTSGRILSNLWRITSEMFPPEPSVLFTLGKPAVETLAMSVVATLLAIVLSLPLSFLAAKNTTLHPLISPVVKGFFNALRTIPELIMGVIFVAAVGFGILPGVLALGLHSAGMLGKFYAEAIETADPGLVEAVEAVGGSRFQVIVFGILPQVVTHFIDYSLYRWEYNFRASTIVGMVGAGGIGFQLIASLRMMQYKDLFTILAVVFVMVQLVDYLGNLVRQKVLNREEF
jgi:phosphonate transport system permease protein